MSHLNSRLRLLAIGTAAILAMLVGSAPATAATPKLELTSLTEPSHLPPGGTGTLVFRVTNQGDVRTDGPVVLDIGPLPDGLTPTALTSRDFFSWSCDLVALTCENKTFFGTTSLMGTGVAEEMRLTVDVAPTAASSLAVSAGVSGGGSSPDTTLNEVTVDGEPASFGIDSFIGEVKADVAGQPATDAGSHPYAASTTFVVNSVAGSDGQVIPTGDGPKDIVVDLPPGFVGNPSAVPTCTEEQLTLTGAEGASTNCPIGSQVGLASIIPIQPAPIQPYMNVGIFNMVPPEGTAALFGFYFLGTLVHLEAEVRSGTDYGVTITSRNTSQGLPLMRVTASFWGTPADEGHDAGRGKCIGNNQSEWNPFLLCPSNLPEEIPLLTQPSDCSAGLLETTMRMDSWAEPGVFDAVTIDHDVNGVPFEVENCEAVPFEPTLSARPTTNAAGSPTGLDVNLSIPQQGLVEPDAIASAHLKKAEVTLPRGMAVNPSSADGLDACSPQQVGLTTPPGAALPQFTPDPARCPDGSKIASVEIETPVFEHALTGNVYLASQGSNPFKSLLALYLAVADPKTGVVVKLPGRVSPDPATGQLRTSFDNNPQLPFSNLRLQFKSGPRAPLMTPNACGTYTTESVLTSWSGGPPVPSLSSFEITTGPGGSACPSGGFDPGFQAGTQTPLAGTYSPFVLRFSRADATQELSGVASASLPAGLTGKLAGIPYCSDAALAGISSAVGTGAAQVASPSCPAASQVGVATAAAGAGSNPFYVKTGRAYLAGPYQGAPLSLAIVTPAVAGPFDLGNVTVRAALHVDSETARISSGPVELPRYLEGIPLSLRSVELNLDRSGFTLNPTNCEPKSISAVLTGVEGARASRSSHFQVGGCGNLGFKPKLSLRLKGGTRRAAYPKLRAVLTARPGQANIGRASVALPHSVFLAQEHIRTICTRVQFAADACPRGSVYGKAKAWTPLLDQPLEGPVYLRSSNNPLPDLVVALRGQVDVDLVARIDSVNGGIRNTFESVPDAPVTRFVLQMRGGKKSLLVNSRNLCKSTGRATVKMDGQNGRFRDFRPSLKVNCKKSKRKKAGGKKPRGGKAGGKKNR